MGKKTFIVSDGGDLNNIEEWIHDQARELWKDPNDEFEVVVECRVKPAPYYSRWTQSPVKTAFRRNTCPVCGTKIPEDSARDGYPEMTEECPVGGSSHYRFSMNMFGDWLTVGGIRLDRTKDLKKIDELLDQIGDKEFIN